jgi:hypothetical protein
MVDVAHPQFLADCARVARGGYLTSAAYVVGVDFKPCPNCFGTRGCQYCKPYGIFGLVPDEEVPRIVLESGKSAYVPRKLKKQQAYQEWLENGGGHDTTALKARYAEIDREPEQFSWLTDEEASREGEPEPPVFGAVARKSR